MSVDIMTYSNDDPVHSQHTTQQQPDEQPAFKRRCYPHSLRHYSAQPNSAYSEDSDSDDHWPETLSASTPGFSDLKMPALHRRREMLDLSINKLQTMNTRAPELRKSVLIFNTMRAIQDELDSEGGDPVSPVSSVEGDLELDTLDSSSFVTSGNSGYEATSAWMAPTQVYTDLSTAYSSSEATSEIYSMSYEVLNSRSFDYSSNMTTLAHPEDGDDDDGLTLANEDELIDHLGLRSVYTAILND